MPASKPTYAARQPALPVSGPFRQASAKARDEAKQEHTHVYGDHVRCATDTKGFPTPNNAGRAEIVLDASEGFIPLWAKGMTLRWRFQAKSLAHFEDPEAAKAAFRKLLGDSILLWGDAVPIKFAERKDAWDFEVVAKESDDCDISGCVLASAFFPDAGLHKLTFYPRLLGESKKEQVETLAHEIGHIFGLRHFFAKVSEKDWPVELFGKHKPFSIMNYGAQSKLSAADKADLRRLYQQVWAGELTEINGTPVRLMRPYHLS
jgi:hypothetical protein